MKTSAVELRHSMRDVIGALERGESVKILHRGQLKGVVRPPQKQKPARKAREHDFFGSARSDAESVAAVMQRLRGGRVDAV